MDGPLVDSEPLWFEVETDLVRSLGGTWSSADQEACLGGTIEGTAAYMVRHTGTRLGLDEVRSRLIGKMATRLRDHVPVHAGALELVDAVRAAGVPTGLVSSSYRVLVDAVLDRLGRHRFDVTVSGDEIAHGKPHPEPYLTAAARLGVHPEQVVVVEDASTGIESAEAAGCHVVAVPSLGPIPAGARRAVVAALTDIDPAWLLSLPGGLRAG